MSSQHFFSILFFSLVISSAAFAQVQISGTIIDKKAGEPLPWANVVLEDTDMGAASDQRGFFVIKNVPAGQYTLTVTRIGYAPESQSLQLSDADMAVAVSLTAEYVKSGEVIITATREYELRSEVAAATEIITAGQIESSGAQSLGEVLQGASGVFIKNYGDIGALKTVNIRGSNENQVLILLDGQRLNHAQGTAPDLGDIPLQAIERIEIVRGGHSALYGSDAIGGVVNLITHSQKTNYGISANAVTTIGSFGTQTIEGNLSQQIGDLSYFVTHKYAESNGDFEFEDEVGITAKRSNNELKYHDTFLNFNYLLSKSGKLGGFVQFHDAERGAPGSLAFPSELATQKDKSWKFNLKFDHQFSQNLNLRTAAFYYNFKQNYDSPNLDFPEFGIFSEHKNDVMGINTQSNWRWSKVNKLTVGYEFRQDKINSTDVSKQDRVNHGLFAQNKLTLPLGDETVQQISFIPAVRLDDYSESDAQISPKIGVVYNYTKAVNLALRGNVGRSYRLPSFNDLYWPAGQFSAGNPNLEPEKGIGFDLGASFAFKQAGFWEFDVTYFHNSLDNLIIWGPNTDGVWQPQNVQEANLEGLETSVAFLGLKDVLSVKLNHNYLKTSNESGGTLNGNELIYRPNHTLGLTVSISLKAFSLNAYHKYTGKRFTAEDNSASLDSFAKTDVWLSGNQPISDFKIKASVGVKNIFDNQAQVLEAYPTPGREFRVSLGLGI